jgi:DNA-binding NtrC family response regulator
MKLLVLDDSRGARLLLRRLLEARPDVEVVEASDAAEARAALENQDLDAMLLDIRLSDTPGDRGGLELLRWARSSGRNLPAVMVTGVSEIAEIREAMRQGAQDYVLKDELCAEMLLPIIDGIRERFALQGEVERLRSEVGQKRGLAALVGSSSAMERVRKLVARVADADAPILLRGPTGSGKELVARAIHYSGRRASEPLLAVNCSALPGTLIESLVFGHQRGAFTGADRRVRGQLELAGNGTLLLDEIAEMPIELQAKLLRVLEERKFRPLGAEQELALGARIIASTHVDLEARIEAGSFREDLYFRLNVVSIDIPPLSARPEDVPLLLQAFAAEQQRPLRFSAAAIAWLGARPWPGNARELKNVVERLSLLSDSDSIDTAELEEIIGTRRASLERELVKIAQSLLALGGRLPADGPESKLAAIERVLVEQALLQTQGNKSAAARLLGVHRKMLERLVKARSEHDSEAPEDPA